MKIGVAIATLNDGPHLGVTVACLDAGSRRPDMVVACDDCGIEPAQPIPGVEILRNDVPQGSGPAKHQAVERCLELGADFVVVIDGHVRVPYDLIEILAEEHTKSPRAVLSPVSTGIESNPGHHGMGANLVFDGQFWVPRWAPERRGEWHTYRVPCPMGGCYAMGAATLLAIGGYAPALIGYGREEEYLALRAWLTGHECAVVPRASCPHFYRPANKPPNRERTVPESTLYAGRSMWINQHVMAMTCFESGVYERVYAPRLGYFNPLPFMPAIHHVRDILEANRTIPDEGLKPRCGVAHP